MAPGDIYATDRFLYRWYLQAFPRRSPVNDLARIPRLNVPVQHYAFPGDHWYSGTWGRLAQTLLCLHLCWLLLLQSVVSFFVGMSPASEPPPPPLDFFPNYLFTALSSFSWVCWVAPNNVKLNQLFGITHGLAMGVITFDWGQITSFYGSPLANPWWSAANAGIALLFFTWFLVPILYVSDKNYLFLSLLFFVHLPTVHQHLVQRFLTHGLLKVI